MLPGTLLVPLVNQMNMMFMFQSTSNRCKNWHREGPLGIPKLKRGERVAINHVWNGNKEELKRQRCSFLNPKADHQDGVLTSDQLLSEVAVAHDKVDSFLKISEQFALPSSDVLQRFSSLLNYLFISINYHTM
jgi:hypothetical protein